MSEPVEWDNLTDTVRVYSVVADDAIDLVESDVVGYAGDVVTPPGGEPVVIKRGTRNPALIKARPGRSLRAAVVKALPMAVGVGLDDIPSDNGRALQAFRVACLSVENIPHPGESLGPTVNVYRDGKQEKAWGSDDLNVLQAQMGRDYMYEIGAFILARSNQGKARGGVPLYTPQHFLEPVLLRSAQLRAAQNKSNDGILSSETSASGSPAASDENSDGPGIASAGGAPAPAE